MIVPFNRDYLFENQEFTDYWVGAVVLWDVLTSDNKIFLLIKWKNDADSLGQIYSSIRFSSDTLHKMYAYDIRSLSQDILEEKLDDLNGN